MMRTKAEAFGDLITEIEMTIGASGTTGSGFHPVFCPACGNKGQKKGGFRFEPESIIYNCFRGRCDATTVYNLEERPSRKFRELMDLFGIKIPVELLVSKKRTSVELFRDDERDQLFTKNTYVPMKLPPTLVPINTHSKADRFLSIIEDRCLLPYDYYYDDGGDFNGCMAMPVKCNGKIIAIEYYTKDGKYITITKNKHVIMVRDDWLKPNVVVVEGVMDALCFPNTVALKTSKISPEMAYHLKNYDPIVLPDRLNSQLYESAKYFDFRVCLPDWEFKDLNEAVIEKGIFVAARMMRDGVYSPGLKSDTIHRGWAINERKNGKR